MAYTTINKPTDYFNTKLYTGDNVDGRTITGVGFQPDFSWVKARSSGFSHYIIDAIRYDSGASKYLKLDSSSTSADETPSSAGWISELNSDGYVCKNGTSNTDNCNENGVTYASWNWLGANGTSANTDGSINSTVSVNTTSGFSIVSYTGTGANATVGHGLGQAPDMIIVKRRDGADGWKVYHSSRGATKYLQLNTGDAEGTLSSQWNNTEPTSSVFSVGTAGDINGSGGRTYIAYCFANKQGYSKFGSYTGNGSTDGTFVYTGFKPAFVLAKNASITEIWTMSDNKRDSINPNDNPLHPNNNDAESVATSRAIDLLSNGFKCRGTDPSLNGSGNTIIYMAFASAPLVGGTGAGVPCTAR